MRLLKILVGLTGMAVAVTAQTTQPETRAVSLQDCTQMALERNLGLQIARYNPVITLYTLKSAYSGYDPSFSASGRHTFSLSGGGFNTSIGTNTPPTTLDADRFDSSVGGLLPWGLTYGVSGNLSESYGRTTVPFDSSSGSAATTLTQPLLKNLWIDGTRLAIKQSKIDLRKSDLDLRSTIISTVSQVENAYYDLIAARENVKVQEQALQLAERLAAENKRRVEVGALAPLDEKQAESQVAARRTDLITAQQSLGTRQNALRRLISDDYQSVHDVIYEPTESLEAPLQLFNLQESWAKGMSQRPDLLIARLDIERQGVQIRFNRNQLFPELDLIGSYGHNASGASTREFSDALGQMREGSRPSYYYGAQLTMPLANIAARNSYKSSKVTLEQLLLGLKNSEQGVLSEIDEAIRAARASYDGVGSTREARLYAEAALEAEQKKLENGKSTSFVVLQLQRDLTAARSAEISALAAYNKSLTTLAQAEGSTLERRKIDVNVVK